MSYKDHAIREFRAAGWINEDGSFKDEMQEAICNHVLALLDVFHNEGHSGTSAPYTVNLFKRLAMFEPLVPLSGDDEEWNQVGDTTFQNNRCSDVFKDTSRFDGKPYWLHGIVFWEWWRGEDGTIHKSYFTSSDSCVTIEFPWNKPEIPQYVFCPTEEFPNEVL